MKRVATFEAGYERTGVILLVDEAICDVCKATTTCLSIDSSGEEYGPGLICKSCIDKAFKE
jgi:hypothetical protein